MEELNAITRQVIGAAMAVHTEMGPGLLESVYQKCMEIELAGLGMKHRAEVPVQVCYRGQPIPDVGFRMDLLVEEAVVVELKSVEMLLDVHKKQLLTYLRVSHKRLGLLINFNETHLRNGVIRIIN
ncbi:MAG: GxxExxY protein [Kiritimatiellae bacterium]|nr:GxxExxY protein [Kiritimatiellia bacterium]